MIWNRGFGILLWGMLLMGGANGGVLAQERPSIRWHDSLVNWDRLIEQGVREMIVRDTGKGRHFKRRSPHRMLDQDDYRSGDWYKWDAEGHLLEKKAWLEGRLSPGELQDTSHWVYTFVPGKSSGFSFSSEGAADSGQLETYDAQGRVTLFRSWNPIEKEGSPIQYFYSGSVGSGESIIRKEQHIYFDTIPHVTTIRLRYDSLGRVTDSIWQKRREDWIWGENHTKFEYDSLGRRIRISAYTKDKLSYFITFSFGEDFYYRLRFFDHGRHKADCLLVRYNELGQVMLRGYWDWPIRKGNPPNMFKDTFRYSPAGRLIEIRHSGVPARNGPGSQLFEYDVLGRLKQVLYRTPRGYVWRRRWFEYR